jgi:hypothetical protein
MCKPGHLPISCTVVMGPGASTCNQGVFGGVVGPTSAPSAPLAPPSAPSEPSASPSSSTNLTRSPARSIAGGSWVGSKRFILVWPSRCHPPGVHRVYLPTAMFVCMWCACARNPDTRKKTHANRQMPADTCNQMQSRGSNRSSHAVATSVTW